MSVPTPLIILRPYQEDLVNELRLAFTANEDPCLVLPTGGGKTVISGGLAVSSQEKNRQLWFVAHRNFLIDQTIATFTAMGIQFGVLADGYPFELRPTMIVSIDTLHRRRHKLNTKPDVVVWDECHHTPSGSWRTVWEWCGPDCFHMGLTATPMRLDGKGLRSPGEGKPGFQRLVLGPTVADLMSWGNLSYYRAYAPSSLDLSGIGTEMGDYKKKQLKKAVNEQVIVGDVVSHYRRLAENKRMIYFTVSVEYSERLAAEFTAAGYPAQHLDARDTLTTRREAAQRFARGELKVLTNVALFIEGYDLAAQAQMDVTVEGVGLVRPTQSEALAIQQMGRCLRPKDEPAIIIDHARVCEMHGLPDTDRDWTLEGRARDKPKSMVKKCPGCLAIIKITARACPHCGHLFLGTPGSGRKVEHKDGELVQIDPASFNAKRRTFSQVVGQCKTLQDFQKAAKILGYKPGWAWKAWKEYQELGYVPRPRRPF